MKPRCAWTRSSRSPPLITEELYRAVEDAILASSAPAVAADWVLWEKTSWVGVRMNQPDKITTIGVYPTKPTCAAAAPEAREGTRGDQAGQLGVSVRRRAEGRCGRSLRVELDDQWSALF